MKNNWPIMNDESCWLQWRACISLPGKPEESSFHGNYSLWAKVGMVMAGAVNLELSPHHQANARNSALDARGLILIPTG